MADSPRGVAIDAAREAGRALKDLYGRVESIRFKGDVDLVTEADERSESIVVGKLREHFPDHAILSEESGFTSASDGSSRCRWIIDPLDGTTNFAHAYPMFAVSIALEVDGVIEVGAVYAPVLDELYVAERGEGATLNGERLTVSVNDQLVRSMLVTGFHYDREIAVDNVTHWRNFLRVAQAIHRDGSAALDLCYIAAGRYDGYWELSLFPWDTAAGSLMVTEAGGKVTDVNGDLYLTDQSTILASNGRIHDLMLAVLNEGRAELASLR